jgi:hypothetical protein
LLELVDAGDAASVLASCISDHVKEYTQLVPGRKDGDGERNARWKIVVNASVEPDL